MSVTQEHLEAAVRAGVADVEQNVAILTTRFNDFVGDVDQIALRLEKRIDGVAGTVDSIAHRLDAKPLRVFIKGRATNLVDKVLPLSVVAGTTWVIAHFLS